ncbi:hypothetical protein CGC21_13535 [Leishmania donovani]|uniref:Uncharacterized protein n=1 Tax=Leishmania donovani TaxID=5661 RepID=A0A504XTC0_LEIDO|nr:hypothetical protein CGC21_13535 [Leishmania donovani]
MEMLTADDAIVMPLREGAQVPAACIHRFKGPALGRFTEAARAAEPASRWDEIPRPKPRSGLHIALDEVALRFWAVAKTRRAKLFSPQRLCVLRGDGAADPAERLREARARRAATPDESRIDAALSAVHMRSTKEPRRCKPCSIAAAALERLSASTEGDFMATDPALSSPPTALSSFNSSSTTTSAQSTPAAQNRGALAAQDTHAALSSEPRWEYGLTKKCVLTLTIKPVSCLAMVRITTPLHPEASSPLPQRELKSSTDRELCSVTYNQRKGAKMDISDTPRGQKRLRGSEYSKEDIHRLRIKPVRNFSICRVLEAGGSAPAGEAQRHSELLSSSPAVAPCFTAITQRSGATTANADDARKVDRGRAHHYAKADIMSLRLKPLKGYAVYRVS